MTRCCECGAPATVDTTTYETPLGPRPILRFDLRAALEERIRGLSDEALISVWIKVTRGGGAQAYATSSDIRAELLRVLLDDAGRET